MGKKAGKFKQGFVSAVKEELEWEERQKRLHEKHGEISENTVIVEKTNTLKFTLKMLARGLHLCATILLLILAAIGILALLYPEVRAELLQVLERILSDARNMTGF